MIQPRVTDNDHGEISVTDAATGKLLRGWYYHDDNERRVKMLCAREWVEGYCEGYRAGLDWSEAMVMAGIEKLFSSPTTQ